MMFPLFLILMVLTSQGELVPHQVGQFPTYAECDQARSRFLAMKRVDDEGNTLIGGVCQVAGRPA